MPPDIDHEPPENFWTISRIWNFSEDWRPQYAHRHARNSGAEWDTGTP